MGFQAFLLRIPRTLVARTGYFGARADKRLKFAMDPKNVYSSELWTAVKAVTLGLDMLT